MRQNTQTRRGLLLLLVVVLVAVVHANYDNLVQEAKQDAAKFLQTNFDLIKHVQDANSLQQILFYTKPYLNREQTINLLDLLAQKKSALACKLLSRPYYQDAIYFIAKYDLPQWSDCLFDFAPQLGISVINTPKWKNEQDWLRWVKRVPSFAVQTIELKELRKEFSGITIQQALSLRNDWRDESKAEVQYAMQTIWTMTMYLSIVMLIIVSLPYLAAWMSAAKTLPLLIGVPVLVGYGIAKFAPEWMATIWTSLLLFYSVIMFWPSMVKAIFLGCIIFCSFFMQDFDGDYSMGAVLVVLYLFGCVMYAIMHHISTKYRYTAFVRREETKNASTFAPLFVIAIVYAMSWLLPLGGIGYFPVEQFIDTMTGFRQVGIKAVVLALMVYAIQGSYNYDHLSVEHGTHVSQTLFQMVWMIITVILMGIMTVVLFGIAFNYVTACAFVAWCIRNVITQRLRAAQQQPQQDEEKPE